MKQLSIILIIVSLLFTLNSSSQSNVQVGALGVFSKTKGVGLEIVDNIQAAKNFSIGLGIRPIAFNANISRLYIPVFGTVKYYYPLQKWKLFASLDPGYGIYPSEYIPYISPDFHRNGAIYLSGGVGIMGASVLAPYASIHFTKFGFTEHLGSSKQYRPISTFNISAGIALNRNASVYSKIRKPDVLPTEDDYYTKSKHQRNVGRILLGTGIALIGSGIAIAVSNDDPIVKGLSIVFIGGLGSVSSLVSIPFFVSSERNKRKIINL